MISTSTRWARRLSRLMRITSSAVPSTPQPPRSGSTLLRTPGGRKRLSSSSSSGSTPPGQDTNRDNLLGRLTGLIVAACLSGGPCACGPGREALRADPGRVSAIPPGSRWLTLPGAPQTGAYWRRKSSRSRFRRSLWVSVMPCGPPAYSIRRAPCTSLAVARPVVSIGTTWSSSPWMTSVGTFTFFRSSRKSEWKKASMLS
mmetsp:Transcript_1430/g.4295  ORF Transcript_1430/g.4295 Transcript_1430/m.4295 type:complete len:201 (+) Transcript_1430:461-1063(+)